MDSFLLPFQQGQLINDSFEVVTIKDDKLIQQVRVLFDKCRKYAPNVFIMGEFAAYAAGLVDKFESVMLIIPCVDRNESLHIKGQLRKHVFRFLPMYSNWFYDNVKDIRNCNTLISAHIAWTKKVSSFIRISISMWRVDKTSESVLYKYWSMCKVAQWLPDKNCCVLDDWIKPGIVTVSCSLYGQRPLWRVLPLQTLCCHPKK